MVHQLPVQCNGCGLAAVQGVGLPAAGFRQPLGELMDVQLAGVLRLRMDLSLLLMLET